MSRGWRSAPYPAPFLLKRLKELSGRIVLSSDSHSAAALLYGFRRRRSLQRLPGLRRRIYFPNMAFMR